MRANFLLLVVLVVGALGVSWLLIPRQEELALIQYKSAQYEEARLAYEEQIAAGDYSAAVVAPLADIYLFYGEPEAAIRIVERFVAQRPADVGALRLLAKYSRDAQQWDGYRHALERIVALAPEEQPVRDLLARYRIAGDHARVRDMLALLVERRYATGPDYEALAQLQAAQGNYAAAVVTLQEQFELLPDTMTVTAIQLWTSLLLDIDDIDGALARARQWLERNPDAGSTLQLVYLLSGRGQKAPALALLDRIDGDEREATDTLAARIGLEIDLGRRADAWPRLQRLHREDRLPSGLIVAYVDVALSQGDLDAAFAEAARHPPERLPGGLLVAMIARLNVPAVVSATFLVNPFTALPVYLMCYTLGTWMLGLPLYPFAFEPSWAWVRNELLLIWRPLLLGCLTCGLMAGFASWLLLDRFWLWRVRKKYRDRHRREQR